MVKLVLSKTLIALAFICVCTMGDTFTNAAERALSKPVHAKLTSAQQALQEKQFDSAIQKLKSILIQKNLSSFEKAATENFLGVALMRKGDWSAAVTQFEKAYHARSIEAKTKRNIAYNLSQSLMKLDRWEDALTYLKAWEKGGRAKTPQENLLMAQLLRKNGRSKQAISYAEKTLELSGKEIGPNEIMFLLNLYYQDKDYGKALKLIERATKLYPKNDYFMRQSAALASKLGRNNELYKKLAVMYRMGQLTTAKQVMALAQMTMDKGAPFKAAMILEDAQSAVGAQTNLAYLSLRAKALIQARAWTKAQTLLEITGGVDTRGKLHVLLGDVLSRQSKWPEAITAYKSALSLLDKKQLGAAWLALGYAELKLGLTQNAFASLKRARAFEAQKQKAQQLLAAFSTEKVIAE